MPQMKGHRRQPQRLRVNFRIGQPFGPFGEIVEGQIKRVQHGAA
jgi:hypothetical protein